MLNLHSESSKRDKEALSNVNKEWLDKIFLAFSPLVGVGVNFSVLNHFDKMYGYAVGSSETVRVFLQMMGRIRYLGSSDIVVCVSPRMNLCTNAQLFSLEYAEKYCNSIIQRDHDESSTLLFKNEQGQLCETQKISQSIWNRLRAYKIQETLNSSSNNFITMLKHKVEAAGDIFEMAVADEPVKKVVFKKDIDRIISAPLLTEKEYDDLKQCNDLTENDRYSMKKIQMARELSFKDNISNDELNPCLRIYSDNQKQIDNILNYYKVDEEKIEKNDEYEQAKILNINSAFKKVINALGCEFIPKNMDHEKLIDKDVDKNAIIDVKSNKKAIKKKANDLNTSGDVVADISKKLKKKQQNDTEIINNDIVADTSEKSKKKQRNDTKIINNDIVADISKKVKKKQQNDDKINNNIVPDVPKKVKKKQCDYDQEQVNNIVIDAPKKIKKKQQNDDDEMNIDDEHAYDNFFLKYEQKYFEDKINQIDFTEGEINSLGTHGRAKNKYEIVKMVLSRFGIKVSVESKQKCIKGLRKSFRTYKFFYDTNLWNILYCKTIYHRSHYSDEFVEYLIVLQNMMNLLKRIQYQS